MMTLSARWRALVWLGWAIALSACIATPQSDALRTSVPTDLASRVLLDSVPFHPQEDYQCGPAALATVLQTADVDVSPEALVSQVYIPARRGSLQLEMLATTRRYGRIPYELQTDLGAVLAEVDAGRPVLVMQNLGLNRWPQWHYAVVVGYDLDEATMTLRSGVIRDYTISLQLFERTWQRAEHWAVVALRPGELPAQAEPLRYFETVALFEEVAESSLPDNAEMAELTSEAWEAGYEAWPTDRLIAIGLSNHAYERGELERAEAILERLLEHSPDYETAQQNLVHIRLELAQREQSDE